MSDLILELNNLEKHFPLEAGLFARYGRFVYAVNDVSLKLHRGESYGLVGESGCGKTTLARLAIQMYKQDGGEIFYHSGEGSTDSDSSGPPSAKTAPASPAATKLSELNRKELFHYRTRVKYIFQDPARSLNPRMSIYHILTAGWRQAPSWPGEQEAREEAAEMMRTVGLSPDDLNRRPSDFSGGQRQRISIARALILKPELLICDEVVSALDVSIQSQILNLLLKMKEKFKLTMLFIAHDLTVTTYLCDRIAVMYRGRLMEEASSRELVENRFHPYTRLLYDSIPSRMDRSMNLSSFEPFDATKPLTGCPFYHRCSARSEKCLNRPPMEELSPGHFTACFHPGSS